MGYEASTERTEGRLGAGGMGLTRLSGILRLAFLSPFFCRDSSLPKVRLWSRQRTFPPELYLPSPDDRTLSISPVMS